MSKINAETARAEIEKWLDVKRIQATKRENLKPVINILEEAVADGFLTVDEDGTIEQTLIFPIEGEIKTETLKYKPRLNTKMLTPYMKGVKSGDQEGRLNAHICALTAQPRAVIDTLDNSTDLQTGHAIATFFLT